MAVQTIRRVPIWSGVLRLLHWTMAAALLGLLASGWVLDAPPSQGWLTAAAEVHVNLAWVLLVLVLVRGHLLFFGSGPAEWRDFLPDRAGPALQVLRFYATLGRAPLPAYFAHNPLWGPLYLLIYALLVVQMVTGLAGAAEVHLAVGYLLAALTAAHVFTAVVHDWQGTGSDVSALINGHRIFVSSPADLAPGGDSVAVELDLGRAGKGRDDR
jgi:Ni/Fe-hydrogenase 1 B-type cytochrome subunit